MKRMNGWLACAAMLAGALTVTAQAAGVDVTIDSGPISGKFQRNTTVRAFLGIPFAAPPVGDLRWKPPQPVAAWQAPRAATTYGAQCMQPGRSKTSVYFEYAGEQPSSEDCLFLNVWAPSDVKDGKLPVMVWIYGGGFQQGSAANPVFDGAALAARGVVVVSVNYRVGIFGFLAHPELTAESAQRASGNYGLLDLVAGLNWVKRNAARFGGDADNVTIFGQSAGAAAVSYLYTSPLARGLFARGIAESFGVANKTMPSLADGEKAGLALGEKAGAPTLSKLRELSAAQLLATKLGMSPIVDGYALPANPYAVFAEGKEAPVPLLTGWNSDEGTTFPHAKSLPAYQDWVRRKYPEIADQLLQLYPAGTDDEARNANKAIVRDALFAWGPWAVAQLHAKNGFPTYLYHFSHKQPLKAGVSYDEIDTPEGLGTFHSSEYPYIFGTLDVLSRDWTDADRLISDTLQSYWVAYAYAGSPNAPGLVNWPRSDAKAETTMFLGDKVGVGPVPQLDRIRLFDQLGSPFKGF
ncbi:carboxylesterase family protein [Bradyrhizobium sp. STM 3809]|uniref:carboxylesterase/lipase family protein n=1 Tax=Bradyrhizobium sp. STM 3809 TaxID=551936 RepID=UPI0002408E56|nr:carboxylesterase family protein [Bradyrhizobium sp. STM 3809]CCE01034.1 putative Carboxylesterase, type B [Bradyrhizobium sp. STM 3809]